MAFGFNLYKKIGKFALSVLNSCWLIFMKPSENVYRHDISTKFYNQSNQPICFGHFRVILISDKIEMVGLFLQTRRTAHWLAEKMTKDGHAVALLSGDLDIAQRAAIINRFRDGKEKVLITTNVSARGRLLPVQAFFMPPTHTHLNLFNLVNVYNYTTFIHNYIRSKFACSIQFCPTTSYLLITVTYTCM